MTAFSPAQQDGLKQIVGLMDVHNLTPADVKKAAAEDKKSRKLAESGKEPLSKSDTILRLFVYLGGTLIFAGLGVFINVIWEDIGSLPRVIITFGTGFVAYLCGVLFAHDPKFERAATPAFILAFLLQPTGLFVLLEEYFGGDQAALGGMIVFGPLALQQGLTFLKFRRPALLLFSLLYLIGFAGSFVEYYDFDRGSASLIFGLFLLLVTMDMQMRSRFRELTPTFFVISSALFLAGVYYYVGRTSFDPIALSIVLSMLGFAVFKESKTLYVLSILYVGAYFCGGPGGGWYFGPDGWNFYGKLAALFTGSSLLLAGHWLSRTNYISLYPVWMFAGTSYALAGAYGLVYNTAFEPLFAGVAALAIYGALLLRSRAVLAASVLSLISFIVSYTAIHFADTVGWPLLLIFLGFVILGAGFLFARLAGRIKHEPAVRA